MDACEGGVYNSAVEWHRERGYWFEPPRIGVRDGGVVSISLPASWGMELDSGLVERVRTEEDGTVRILYPSPGATAADNGLAHGEKAAPHMVNILQALYDVPSRLAQSDPLSSIYRHHINTILERLVLKEGRTFGALILEPILMGAGGMIWVDPLFQRVLIDVVREREDLWSAMSQGVINTTLDNQLEQVSSNSSSKSSSWSGLPVIFDEVFVGLYRLGFLSSSFILGTTPDISVLAKILTGGLVPMSVTLASDAIYDAFWAEEKKDALLHGHSYTAHPIGCAVAVKTLSILEETDSGEGEMGQEWTNAKARWGAVAATPAMSTPASDLSRYSPDALTGSPAQEGVWSLWDPAFISTVSLHHSVDEVMSLGTVMAVQLGDDANAGEHPAPFSFCVSAILCLGHPFFFLVRRRTILVTLPA